MNARPVTRTIPAGPTSAGGLAIAVGATILTGWAFDIPLLKSLLPDAVAVKVNTALGFILAGAALTSPALRGEAAGARGAWVAATRLLALLAGVIGLVTIGEYWLDWDTGFDQWLFPELPGAIGTSQPGRMAPETAVCFVLLSAAILGAGAGPRSRWQPAAAAVAGAFVTVLAGASLLSYFTPTLGARGWWGQTIMAVPTALLFGVLGVAVTRAALRRCAGFWHLDRPTSIAFAGGLLLLMLVNLSLNRGQAQATAFNAEVHRHQQKIAGLIRLGAHANRAQTHTRGYLLTGEARFLQAHREADSACRAALGEQRGLVAGDIGEPWPQLFQQIQDVLGWFQYLTTTPRPGDDSVRRARVLHGEDLMDRLRHALAQRELAEEQAMRELQAAGVRLGQRSIAIVAFGTLLSAGIFLGTTLGLNRAHRERGLALAALRDSNQLLEHRVHERTVELAHQKHLLEQAGKLAHMGAWEVELDTQAVKWSDVVREIHEVEPGYVPTLETGISFYAPASRPVVTAAVERAIAHGAPFDLELQLFTARGRLIWVRASGQAVCEGGRVVRLIGMFQDITARRHALEAAQRQGAQLEAANRELESFAYSVSHDLRAPLRGIDGFSRILLEDYADKFDEAGRDSIQRIRTASQRMAQLIDDLLNLSRVTRTEMRREPVDLSALARGILAEFQRQEPSRAVTVVVADHLHAEGDPSLVRVLMENLLGNAWKFTARRTHARIEFGAEPGAWPEVYFVRDNGAGFDPEYAGKLFGPFQRLHTTQEFPGTGIGLATVQRIAHRHGGRVWAEGRVDAGATFRFTLGETPPANSNPP